MTRTVVHNHLCKHKRLARANDKRKMKIYYDSKKVNHPSFLSSLSAKETISSDLREGEEPPRHSLFLLIAQFPTLRQQHVENQ